MMNISNTILEQLGGGRFVLMTGAKHLVSHSDALSFRLPSRFAKDGINYGNYILDSLGRLGA